MSLKNSPSNRESEKKVVRISKLAWEADHEQQEEEEDKNRYRFQSFNVTHNFIKKFLISSRLTENYCVLAFNFDSRIFIENYYNY